LLPSLSWIIAQYRANALELGSLMRCRHPACRRTAFSVLGLLVFVGILIREKLLSNDNRLRRLSECTGDQEEVAACNMAPCDALVSPAVDCTWDYWSSWSHCGCDGVQTRARSPLTWSKNGGQLCSGPSKELQPCEGTCARHGAVDCEVGSWEAWSDCTNSCLGGQRYRTREIVRLPKNGGQTCSGSLDETQMAIHRLVQENFEQTAGGMIGLTGMFAASAVETAKECVCG